MAVCSIWVSVGEGLVKNVHAPPCSPNRGNSPLSTKDVWETLYLVAGTQS